MKFTCMIVDDEPLAQRVLEKYIASLPSLMLIKTCDNGLEALSFLHQNSVDIIFLDIKMPDLSGLEFLKTLNKPPHIIITTAYSEYALDGYEYSVVDYLLKPISFERFLKAVNKILERKEKKEIKIQKKTEDFVFLKSDKTLHQILFSKLKYIEGYGNYLKVFTDKGRILVSERMNKVEKKLPDHLFIRIHKSYIVSIRKIEHIKENKIYIGDMKIPIGETYKKQVFEILGKYKLSDH